MRQHDSSGPATIRGDRRRRVAANGYVIDLDRDGTATSNDPQFAAVTRAGVTMRWSYDDATDRFRLGATVSGVYVGLEATARWSGDDRICFVIADERSRYWIRRET